ncbi:sulfatase-like hydrolase/transferase [Pedobacter sp. BS3]|uniref:LTA synthase family protein n=1 Tax=Pedobacter sp. BS3 TaxID=2567937 RepID=UPI0011EBA55D|nr:alkaline phosphatase family protein [Pedobacter sp. BS3]TZF83977.1 sulfatase-like hydrolase/transferase [Pedobacter sp. BS3]
MFKAIIFLLRFYLFWLIFFFAERLVFILYFAARLKHIALAEIIKSFLYGLWMDCSMAGYISALPLLIFIFTWHFRSIRFPKKIMIWYTRTLIVLFAILCAANFNIYREWGSKINYKALDFFFTSPTEAAASSASSPLLLSFVIITLLIAFGFWLSARIIQLSLPPKPGYAVSIPLSLLTLGLTFLAIRGNTGVTPMNESMAYYSSNQLLNHAAVNTEWSLIHDILANQYGNKNPYNYLPNQEAEEVVRQLFKPTDSPTETIVKNQNINIVPIIMESFTANIVESLGGEKGITPGFEQLAKNGLLFTHAYAAGDRTDKGIIAVLSAFPSQAVRSIIKVNNKLTRLPSLPGEFAKKGYHTSFYYGGESEFYNFKSYMLSHSVSRIVDIHDFSQKDMNSKWGTYDHVVYRRQLEDMDKEQQPFFSIILTLTNHEPFELPVKSHFPGDAIGQKFRSTAYYADSCLTDYLQQAEKRPWFANTLFIIVADHGHRLPDEKYEINRPERFHIPILLYGGALKDEYRGKRIDKVTSQVDIAAILLNQLRMNASAFTWSKDVLNPTIPGFAFYNWDNGFGFTTAQQTISFDNTGKTITYRRENNLPETDKQLLLYGKACMQEVFQQYLDY